MMSHCQNCEPEESSAKLLNYFWLPNVSHFIGKICSL